MKSRFYAAAAFLATGLALVFGGDRNAATTPKTASVETGGMLPDVRAEVRCDGKRTSFSASFHDPDADLRASGVGFLIGYILEIEARPPDAPAESFASPLLAPDVGVPAPGSVTVGYVEPRAWPDGTRFFLAVHDRDGNLL